MYSFICSEPSIWDVRDSLNHHRVPKRQKKHRFKAFAYCEVTLRSVYFLTLNRSPVLSLHLLLSKNRYGAQRHTGNRGQLSVFYWSMCSSLLEGIDPASNWPCCCCCCCATPTQMSVRQAHRTLHFVPLCRAGHLKNNTNRGSSNDNSTPWSPALINLWNIIFNIRVSSHWAPFRQNFSVWNHSRIIASVTLRPTSPTCLQKSNALSVLYKHITQAQRDTCDFDGIQPSLADLRISLRD